MTKLAKLALALSIICAIASCIAIAPLFILIIFAIVALTCLLICVCIYCVGAIIWLLSATTVNIFSIGTAIYDFAISLFTYIGPIAQFSCLYITPYSGYAAISVGVLGIIISAVALAKAKHESNQDPIEVQQTLSPTSNDSSINDDSLSRNGKYDGIFDPYSVYNSKGKVVSKEKDNNKHKKGRVKKAKTTKSTCITSLIVCIVFTVLAVAIIIFSHFFEGMFL